MHGRYKALSHPRRAHRPIFGSSPLPTSHKTGNSRTGSPNADLWRGPTILQRRLRVSVTGIVNQRALGSAIGTPSPQGKKEALVADELGLLIYIGASSQMLGVARDVLTVIQHRVRTHERSLVLLEP